MASSPTVVQVRTANSPCVWADRARPRAVGGALGANRLCVILPCHRIIASSGRLTGYAGGPEAKRHLIDCRRRLKSGPVAALES